MKSLQFRLVLLATTCLILSALFLSWQSLQHFEQDLPPEMARTVLATSYATQQILGKAVEHGVPFDEMVGVDAFLSSTRKDNPSIAYMVITNRDGKILYQSGFTAIQKSGSWQKMLKENTTSVQTTKVNHFFDTHVPLVFQNQHVGSLHLGQPEALIEKKMQEVSFDVIAVLVVASLIAMELLRFVLTFAVSAPIDATQEFLARIKRGDFSHYLPYDKLAGIGQLSAQFNAIVAGINKRVHTLQEAGKNGHINEKLPGYVFHRSGERPTLFTSSVDYIRWPFFLLIFADSLSLSFFPVFIGEFYSPDMGLSKSLVIGLPISIFMFTWALSMPWAGTWSDRVGHRKAFLVGASVTTLGLILTAFAQSLYDLLLWRCITALGYGLVFITAQSYVTSTTPVNQRTKGMAIFLSSFFAGSLAGSAIGGILSDRLGYSATILLSGVLSAASALFVLRFLRSNPHQEPAAARKKLSWNDFSLLLHNKKFVTITFLAAVPAKIALTGFLYYSAPLYLKFLGNNQSTTGRVMMAYGLAIILLSPFIAKLADKFGHRRWFVSVGGFGAAFAMFTIYFFDSTIGLLVSITLLGIAHAIGVSPQLALINDFCKDVVQEVGSGTATGIFRLIERIGNVLGPIIAGLLIAQFGFNGAFLGIGILCLVCICSFTLLFYWFERATPSQLASAV